MVTKHKGLKLLILCTAAALPLVGGCGKKKSKSSSSSTAGESDVVMAGSLALTNEEPAALKLTGEPYKIYAVTFEDVPKACAAEIADGKFNKTCEDFAGVSFGAFLRQGNKTVATIEFSMDSDSSTNLTTGGGTLAFDISFDPVTGIAKAKVDMTKSDALGADKVAAAKARKGTKDTDIGNLTGSYKATCVANATAGFECPPAGESNDGPSSEMQLYLSQWDHNGKKMLSIWDTKENHDTYFPTEGASEAAPDFKLVVGGQNIALDLTSDAGFKKTLDQAYKALPATLKSKVDSAAAERNPWIADMCEQEDRSTEQFTDANCKYIEAEMETHSWFDYEKNQQITMTQPKFYNFESFATLQDYAGTAQTVEVDCDQNPETEAPWCPWNTTVDANGAGKMKVYKGSAGNEIRLLCKAKDQQGQDMLMQEPAMGATKADALAARGGKKSLNCESISNDYYSNVRQGLVMEIRQMVSDLASSPDMSPEEKEKRCNRYTLASDFTFNKCNEFSQGGGNDWLNMPAVCGSVQWDAPRFGVQIDQATGKLVSNGTAELNLDNLSASAICPTFYSLHKDHWWDRGQTNHALCRDEFVALSVAQQAAKFNEMAGKHADFKDQVLCITGNAEEKAAVTAIEKDSRTPRVRLERFWDPATNTERVSLSCEGAGSGPCVKDGVFLGRISGRHVRGDLKPGVGGAFEVFESEQHTYQRYSPKSQEASECTNAHAFVLKGRIKSASSFEAALSSTSTESCEGDDSSSSDQGGGDQGGGAQGGGAQGGGDQGGGGGGGGKGFSMFFNFDKQ